MGTLGILGHPSSVYSEARVCAVSASMVLSATEKAVDMRECLGIEAEDMATLKGWYFDSSWQQGVGSTGVQLGGDVTSI
jgi:hypothetical protein